MRTLRGRADAVTQSHSRPHRLWWPLGLVVLLSVGMMSEVRAGLILQNEARGAGVFDSPHFTGQTFTAEDFSIQTIGVGLQVFNTQFAFDRSVSMSLFSGMGTNGPLLGTRVLEPAGGNFRDVFWVDFDFSGISLEAGQTYSFLITSPTRYWGEQYNQPFYPNGTPLPGATDYAGGILFTENGFVPILDMRFRVIPVPEPGPSVLLCVGAALLVLKNRSVQRLLLRKKQPSGRTMERPQRAT